MVYDSEIESQREVAKAAKFSCIQLKPMSPQNENQADINVGQPVKHALQLTTDQMTQSIHSTNMPENRPLEATNIFMSSTRDVDREF